MATPAVAGIYAQWAEQTLGWATPSNITNLVYSSAAWDKINISDIYTVNALVQVAPDWYSTSNYTFDDDWDGYWDDDSSGSGDYDFEYGNIRGYIEYDSYDDLLDKDELNEYYFSDDQTMFTNLPWYFNIGGEWYNYIVISSNGFVSFTSTDSGCCSGYDMQYAPQNTIALFWTDLYPNINGEIYYGETSDGYFGVRYDNVQFHDYNGSKAYVTAELKLSSSGEIYIRVGNMTSWGTSNEYVVGVRACYSHANFQGPSHYIDDQNVLYAIETIEEYCDDYHDDEDDDFPIAEEEAKVAGLGISTAIPVGGIIYYHLFGGGANNVDVEPAELAPEVPEVEEPEVDEPEVDEPEPDVRS